MGTVARDVRTLVASAFSRETADNEAVHGVITLYSDACLFKFGSAKDRKEMMSRVYNTCRDILR